LTAEHIKGGKLRALAIAGNTRSPNAPDVPTVEQALGISNYDVRSWFALAGPAGLPKPVVDRLNSELRRAVTVQDVSARLAALGGQITVGTPQEMRDRVVQELALWVKTVEDAGLPKQ